MMTSERPDKMSSERIPFLQELVVDEQASGMLSFRAKKPRMPWKGFSIAAFVACLTLITLKLRKDTPDWLELVRKYYHLPGLAVSVARGGVLQQQAVGFRKEGDPTPMSVKDVFHLGSNTKAMTSTVLAMLIEDGVFTWDTPLFTAFPDRTKNMDPGHQHTTMAMLTSHRSGLSDDWLSSDVALMTRLYDSSLSSSEGRQLVMDGAFSQPPVSTPGTQFIYTNIGYIIIGHLMEQVTGKSWENLLRERLFDPLKMMDCGFGVCPQATPEAVDNPWPHMQTPEGPLPIFPDRQADNPPAFAPAASVHCTMSDYAKFLQLQMDGFNGKATKIVSKESFDRLHGKLPNQAYTSGGWIRINDDGVHGTCLMHSGSNTLNYATAYLMPASDTAFMGMTNVGGDAAANATLTAITDLLTKALLP